MDARVLNAIRRNIRLAELSGNTARADRLRARLAANEPKSEPAPEEPVRKKTRTRKKAATSAEPEASESDAASEPEAEAPDLVWSAPTLTEETF